MTPVDFLLQHTEGRATPFYFYNLDLLGRTLDSVTEAARVNPKFRVQYAMKACVNTDVLETVRNAGLGVDTVSGGEIRLAVESDFNPKKIMFAGVGKRDSEIDAALNYGIKAFIVESLPELEVINERAAAMNKRPHVLLRINPEIDAHTHKYITTGLVENKFGINLSQLDAGVNMALTLPKVHFAGLHFHIGSQITVTEPFKILCERVNGIIRNLNEKGIKIEILDLGGGLAIDYDNPANEIPDFRKFFDTVNSNLDTDNVDEVCFEPGRAIVGQSGWLVTRVLYVKRGDTRTFAIVDAGMTELIRPALYGARHDIVNLSGERRGDPKQTVDIVGPVCESADVFGENYLISEPRRGDILVVKSAGAYGEVMASNYNCRQLNPALIYR